MIAETPAQIGPPLDEAPPNPFVAERAAYAAEFAAPLRHTDRWEQARKDKEAERGRERRKLRREQLGAIKLAFTVEGTEVLRRAEELKRALGSETADMGRGKFITDAPTGKGLMIYSRKIEQIGAAADRAEALGAQTYDHATGEAFWPDHDRKHVKPEGGGESSNDKKITNGSRPDLASGVPVSASCFAVKPGTDLDRGQAVLNVFHRLNTDGVCRLCYQECSEEHIEAVHADETEPRHDQRFGDVVTPEIQKIKKGRAGRCKLLILLETQL